MLILIVVIFFIALMIWGNHYEKVQDAERARKEALVPFPELEKYDIDVPTNATLTSEDVLSYNPGCDYNIDIFGEGEKLHVSSGQLTPGMEEFFASTPAIKGWLVNRQDGTVIPFVGNDRYVQWHTNEQTVASALLDRVEWVGSSDLVEPMKTTIRSLNEALVGTSITYTGWVSLGKIDAVFCHITKNKPDRLVQVSPRASYLGSTPHHSFGYTIPAKNGVEALKVWQGV